MERSTPERYIRYARSLRKYKRVLLNFRDIDRLKEILASRENPVQLIIAGKAHPETRGSRSSEDQSHLHEEPFGNIEFWRTTT
jgi:hypothetical protein